MHHVRFGLAGGPRRRRRDRLRLHIGFAVAVALLLSLVFVPGVSAGSGSSSGLRLVIQNLSQNGVHSAQASTKDASADGVIVEYAKGKQLSQLRQVASNGDLTANTIQTFGASGAKSLTVYKSKKLSTAQLMADFKGAPGVVSVSPNNVEHVTSTTPNDPEFNRLWGMNNTTNGDDIDATNAWDITQGSSQVVIAVLDTGVAYTHEDLKANMWTNPGEIAGNGIDDDGNGYVDDVHGIDVVDHDSDPWDENGHGTHVSGTAAAVGNNGIGVTGVSWKAKIMALRFADASGAGYDSAAIECIYYAIDMKLHHGVNIVAINASWGGYGAPDTALSNAIQAAGDAGIVFCAAAGNDAVNSDTNPYYPADYHCSNIISVGASDSNDRPASFSNYGKTSVDVFAPGVNIWSTYTTAQYFPPTAGDLFYDNMESGSANWTATGTWAITTEKRGSSNSTWSDSPGGNYANSSDTGITSRTIDLSNGDPHDTVLSFWAAFNLEDTFDFLEVEASGDNGVTWTNVGKLTGVDNVGHAYDANLPSSAATNTCKIRFRLVSDDTTTEDGVYIDDVGIAVVHPSSYEYLSGTSMATPHVTGTVALLAAMAPGDSAATRISKILAGVDKVSALSGLCVTGGRLNAARALVTRFEQGSSNLCYQGSWATYSAEWLSGGSFAYTGTAGSSVTVAFLGTRLNWIGVIGPAYGIASVSTDGKAATSVDLYKSTYKGGQVIYTTGMLSYGLHTITITCTGKKNARATGEVVGIDALDVGGTLTRVTIAQDNDSRVIVAGPWRSYSGSALSGGSSHFTSSAGATYTIPFTGRQLRWIGSKGPAYGMASVSVDGAAATTVDLYSVATSNRQILFSTGPLSSGLHTVKIACTGTKRMASAGTTVAVDAFEIVGSATPATRVEQTSTKLVYAGAWNLGSSSSYSGSSYRYVNTSGAAVTINFTGVRLTYVAMKSPNMGKAAISVDGGAPVAVDLYATGNSYQQRIFSTAVLKLGDHKVTISWTGQKHGSSSGSSTINIDAVEVIGVLK